MARDFLFEMPGGGAELLLRHLLRPRRRPADYCRQATSVLEDRAIVLRQDFVRREAGEMDCAPEAIASSGKMMPCDGRGHSGIDPAEDDREAFGDDVGERINHDAAQVRSRSQAVDEFGGTAYLMETRLVHVSQGRRPS
jgi:hypothetical protein